MLIQDIMTVNVHRVTPKTTLKTVDEIFKSVRYHHLLVEDKGVLVGVISDRDVIRMKSPFLNTEQENTRDQEQLHTPVEEFMTKRLLTILKDTDIDYASILLLENNISCLPVIDVNNKIEGIVTWKDLLKFYVYVSGR